MSTTTIRLEEDLKARVAAAAERTGKTSHAFILDAIAQTAEQSELDDEFHSIADGLWANILATGKRVHQARYDPASARRDVNQSHATVRLVRHALDMSLGFHAVQQARDRRLEWRLSALWNDFRFRNDPVYGDNRLPGVPRAAARAQLGWRFAGGMLVAATVEGASSQPIDFANSFHADAYGTRPARVLVFNSAESLIDIDVSNRRSNPRR